MAQVLSLTLPDGGTVTTASAPLGERHAAWLASGAREILAGSSEIPSGLPVPVALPVLGVLLRVGPLQRLAVRCLASVRFTARPRPRPYSWARADARWADEANRTAWLRTPDVSASTDTAAAEVALRLLHGPVRPGARAPIAAFGPALAEAAAAEISLV